MSESDDRRIAVVTGATRGIGKAIATELASAGCLVIGTATSDAGAATIRDSLEALGGTGICLDVSDAEAVKAVIAGITRDYGAPTILVNNAGITRDNLMMRMKDEEWSDVIGTNLSPLFTVSQNPVLLRTDHIPVLRHQTSLARQRLSPGQLLSVRAHAYRRSSHVHELDELLLASAG